MPVFPSANGKVERSCPAGQKLTHGSTCNTQRQKPYSTDACARCALKAQCTKAERRVATRSFDEDARQAMHQRTLDDPTPMKRRRDLAEHPFGIIKAMMGSPRFLVRGKRKAKAELALTVPGFNLKRTITILGIPAILDAPQPSPA